MEIIPWILVVVLAGLAAYLGFRKGQNPYPDAVERLAQEVQQGRDVGEAAPGDPPEVLSLRVALGTGWRPMGQREEDPAEQALLGLFRYMEEAVLAPLESALREGQPGRRMEDAVNALRDLAFYARGVGEEAPRSQNLSQVVQEVTREYARETGVPVKFSGPPGALSVNLASEAFKDALYLLLANAGHFGGGQTVEIVAEAEGEQVRLRVRDRGPGFDREALDRAFDPFWSSDSDALGLGLTHAQRLLEAQGARLRIGNLDQGGAEAVIVLRRAR